MLTPDFLNSDSNTLVFLTICSAYFLNSGVAASRSATAIPAVVWLWGPPCNPGKIALSILELRSGSLAKPFLVTIIMAPRGPRRVLWVVVVMAWT